jgi:hypothetical protein
VSEGRADRRFTYTIASVERRQNPNIPPYGVFSGSPSSNPTDTPVRAAWPSVALKNARRRETTRWLKPPRIGVSRRTPKKPRIRNGYWKSDGSVPFFASSPTHV